MDFFRKLDDAKVRKYIDKSLVDARRILQRLGVHDPSPVQLTNMARKILKRLRGAPSHKYDYDFELAAAEHYMYIRFLATETGDPVCYKATEIYMEKKLVWGAVGKLQSGQAQGGHPVLPANYYIYEWGKRGVKDGLKAYKKMTGGASYHFGKSISTYLQFLGGSGPASESAKMKHVLDNEVRKFSL